MHFAVKGVCVMHCCGPMRCALHFPANQVGGRIRLRVIRGYALSEVCVMRGSTVVVTRPSASEKKDDLKVKRGSRKS